MANAFAPRLYARPTLPYDDSVANARVWHYIRSIVCGDTNGRELVRRKDAATAPTHVKMCDA
ncbi:hypothetical protein OCU04_012534 [Sclerotinia nivalis]|uniref:Uncharacterized protein n=1 Tax=Sclerotinia nivalis TaxID=352851 RepID=A0A9X0A8W7_9HELO|nr:hypothetical protein OCU04_012534 [Sclerotinia nivalis]